MKRFQILMMLAAVAMSTTAAHAQSVSSASLRALAAAQPSEPANGNTPSDSYQRPNEQQILEAAQKLRESGRSIIATQSAPTLPHLPSVSGSGEAKPFSGRVEVVGQVKTNPPACCGTDESCWFTQALRGCAASCQRLRAMCAGSQATREAVAAGLRGQGQEMRTGSVLPGAGINCRDGVTGNAAFAQCQDIAQSGGSCVGFKDFMQFLCPAQFRALNTPAPCCCAKACTCCEACKAYATKTGWGPLLPMQRVIEVRPVAQALPIPPTVVPGFPYPLIEVRPVAQAFPAPVTGVGVQSIPYPMQAGGAPNWIAPPPTPYMPVTRTATKPARLVTPDLEAHCEKMTNRGDIIVLEGNVLLLCKKHAQPIRIEAQRVLVNMKDGSFSVESESRPSTTTSFGVMRTSGAEPMMQRIIVMPAPVPSHWKPIPVGSRVIKVEEEERIFLGEIPPIPGR